MRHPLRFPWLIALFALVLVGCGGGGGGTSPDDPADTGGPGDTGTIDIGPSTTAVWAADFDRSCQSDDDCVPVIEGDVCSCGCQISAINKDMYTSFKKARKRAADNCNELPNCDSCGEPPAVACSAGRCVVTGETQPDAGGDGG